MIKKSNKLVSVIVPVYNSEEYLKKCIDSIINQSYRNIEILCIDDGSTDKSLEILNGYSDDRIKIYKKKNSGVADTRNYGLSIATGYYICSIDNDDIIDKDFIEYFVDNIGDNDILIGGYIRESYDGQILFKRVLHDGKVSPYINLAFWGKLYKTSFIKENNIQFLNTNIADDLYFCSKLYNLTNKIKIINDAKYHWLFNSKSLSNTDSKKMNRTDDLIYTLSKIDEDITFKDIDLKNYFFLRTIIYYLLFSCKKVDYFTVEENYNKLFEYMKKIDLNYKKNKYLKIFNHEGEIFKIKMIIKIFLFLQMIKLDRVFLKIYTRL